MLAPDGSMRKAMSPVPPAMSRIASPARGLTRRTKRSFHNRCIPPDIASFMMSYLRATRLNTSPTMAVFSVAGTCRTEEHTYDPLPQMRIMNCSFGLKHHHLYYMLIHIKLYLNQLYVTFKHITLNTSK